MTASLQNDFQKDLVVLVPDKNMASAVTGILSRRESLTIRSVSAEIVVHPERDPGCRLKSQQLLAVFRNMCAYAIVMFDKKGCGAEQSSRESLETEVEAGLRRAGWRERSAAVVIDPELEAWVWSDSPHVDACLGWAGRTPGLRDSLQHMGLLGEGQMKPQSPKEAMEKALRLVRKPRSSSIYQALAERVSLDRCRDPSFARFREILGGWFGIRDSR